MIMKREFLLKAQENLNTARLTFGHGGYNASANRAYYAAFQAAIAALAEDDIVHTRNPHDWVQAQFSGILIHRRKRYPSKLVSTLPQMQATRDIADYEAIGVGRGKAASQLKHAEEFVSTVLSSIQPLNIQP
jgi:uncharacterized protein (UPF0332 family)